MSKTRAKSPGGRLSNQQLEILFTLFARAAFTLDGPSFTEWSPTEYAKAKQYEVTKAEVAAISRRVTSLIDRGLVEREGKKLALTENGWSAILERGKKAYPELVEMDGYRKGLAKQREDRQAVAATREIVREALEGSRQMDWFSDRESDISEFDRKRALQVTARTLAILDVQLLTKQKQVMEACIEIYEQYVYTEAGVIKLFTEPLN